MNTIVACTDVVHGCIQHDYKQQVHIITYRNVYRAERLINTTVRKRTSKTAAAKNIFTPDQIMHENTTSNQPT